MWQQSVLPTTGKVRLPQQYLDSCAGNSHINTQQRGYKVALAFEFEARVLAFLSHDLLFQVRISLEPTHHLPCRV